MKIRCSCYDEIKEFDDKEKALKFFLDCMNCSEGSEQNRYTQIFLQLCEGHTFCSDDDRITDEELEVMEDYYAQQDYMADEIKKYK